MSFESETRTFQERCWSELYSKLFVDFFNNFEYEGSTVSIRFKYKSFLHEEPLDTDYNTAILNKGNYCRPLRLTTNIRKNATGESIDSEDLGPIMVPELTPRGFIIGGHGYDVANLFREAFGWYITLDKNRNIILSLKTKEGGKYIIVCDNDELFIEHNRKRLGFGIFLKAVTELDSNALVSLVGTSSVLINKTLVDQLNSKGYEMPLSDCIREAVHFTARGNKSKEEYNRIPDSKLRDMLAENLAKIDMGAEGVERYKKFISFQRRSEGSVLLEPVHLTDGRLIDSNTNLNRIDLIKMDNDENITEITVAYQDSTYCIKKFPVDNGEFNYNMMSNIASIAFAVFTGLGMLDDRDSLENRVIENVAAYIVECVRDYLVNHVCKPLDSARNRNVEDVDKLASKLADCRNSEYIVQRYKKETIVQLKDDVNIISELSKTYKLSYKRKSSKARIGDAVRNIKVKQFMRVCPIDTPESKEVGLNTYLTTTAGVDENGFITAAYIEIETGRVVYMNALEEMGIPIMVWNENIEENEYVRAHIDGEFVTIHRSQVKYMDVSPMGLLSYSTGSVPFIESDKSKRALMAANMNRQAVHMFGSERPYDVTGTDDMLDVGITRARDIVKDWAGSRGKDLTEEEIENTTIILKDIVPAKNMDGSLRTLVFTIDSGVLGDIYRVDVPYFLASTSGCYYYMEVVSGKIAFKGNDIVYHHRDIKMDDVELGNNPNFGGLINISKERIDECGYAMGRNLKILFKAYKGYTYEDAVVLNRDLFENKSLTSIYLTEIKTELQENPATTISESFGIEGLNFTTEERSYMQDNGLPAIGSYIRGGQVVIGKVRREPNALGVDRIENASITLDSKSEGWVVDARIIYSEVGKGKQDQAVVSIASFKDVGLGDKFVGRHGNKGVVAKIVPAEDMPFAEDGMIPDMVLNPLGIIARGNVGQLCECIVGMAGYKMNRRFVTPALSDENYETMQALREILREEYGFDEMTVYDGETGLPYPKKMLFGVMHMYKLLHLAERPSKVIGSAGNAVQEVSQQPRNGQRISELQTNAYIAHGATETLDSFFSVQSDDIKGSARLQRRVKEGGSSLEEGIDIQGENKSDELVRAYLRTLGTDIISVDGGVRFKYLTDDDIMDISGYGTENVVSDSSSNAILALHNEAIFGAESKKQSRTIDNRIRRRNNYGRIELGYSVIMPIIFRNPQFLNRFAFVHYELSAANYKEEDDEFKYLKIKAVRNPISSTIVSSLITGGYVSCAFCVKSLSVFDTRDLDNLPTDELKSEALKFLTSLGFNTSEFQDKTRKGKFYSPHKIDILAEMYRNYNTESLIAANEVASAAYNGYEEYLAVNVGYGQGENNMKFDFVGSSHGAISSMCNPVGIDGSEYFVTKMLIMPASFRPRYTTTRGERHNDVDATYIKILTSSNELKNHRDRRMPIDYDVVRLYQALDSCYKKPENSKSTTSISDLLLSSNINKGSTVIRGYVGAKRIAYSARSVISVNPTLRLTECGIPYKQALILWEDNLIWALSDQQIVEGKTALSDGEIHKLIKYLVDGNYYAIGYDLFDIHTNPIEVAKQIEDIVVDQLVEIMADEIVVLNREPALHKFNNLAFVPVLCDGLSIQLHPLVCSAYNADFDGDTMSSIVAKSDTAKREAREKMMTPSNIINPKDGKNIISLKQDIVLGIYMLTMLENNSRDEINYVDRVPVACYDSISIMEQDIDLGYISIYDYVVFMKKGSGNKKDCYYVSTAGRILFNSLLPGNAGFTQNEVVMNTRICKLQYDMRINSKTLNGIVIKCFNENTNNKVTIDLLDRIKEVGIKYVDKSGATISINDFEDKSYIVQDQIDEVSNVVARYDLYEKLKLFPTDEKRIAVINLWKANLERMQREIENSMDESGSVFAIIDSGARGDKSDYNAICGIVGQVRNVDNTIIERPILGNYLKGLAVDEYFISTYQARRGQISTSTKTADSGKNNRDISHMLNNVRVVEENCDAKPYHLKIKWGKVLEETIPAIVDKKITGCKYKYFVGKTLCENVPNGANPDDYLTIAGLELTQMVELELDGVVMKIPRHIDAVHRSLLEGRVIEEETNDWLPKNFLTSVEYTNSDSRSAELVLNETALNYIEHNPEEYIDVRLLIGCCSHGGVCSKCYGKDIETKKLIEVGKYIGLISAMAISEVATQGTMNMHHAAASASGMGDIATRFKNSMNAKETVRISRKLNSKINEWEYTVSLLKGNKFVKVADGLDKIGAVREQGLALTDGIVNITNRVTADGKSIVQVVNDEGVHEYNIYRGDLIVSHGEEVREYQPLIAPYDYNQIMRLDEDYAREFFITDFADIFISGGQNIRAIHFELIGREQTNYVHVSYYIDGCHFHEVFPRHMTPDEIMAELQKRYEPAVIEVREIRPALVGKTAIMDSRDIVANAFSDEMFTKVGKYCMNGKVDGCTSPLTNVYVGRKVRGTDAKKFSTMSSLQERKSLEKKKTSVVQESEIGELDMYDDEFSDDVFGSTESYETEYIPMDTGEVISTSSSDDEDDGFDFSTEDLTLQPESIAKSNNKPGKYDFGSEVLTLDD